MFGLRRHFGLSIDLIDVAGGVSGRVLQSSRILASELFMPDHVSSILQRQLQLFLLFFVEKKLPAKCLSAGCILGMCAMVLDVPV